MLLRYLFHISHEVLKHLLVLADALLEPSRVLRVKRGPCSRREPVRARTRRGGAPQVSIRILSEDRGASRHPHLPLALEQPGQVLHLLIRLREPVLLWGMKAWP